MLSMDSQSNKALPGTRRPRSSSSRKPRLGPHPFLRPASTNASSASPSTHISYDKLDQKATGYFSDESRKGGLVQKSVMPNNLVTSTMRGVSQDKDNCSASRGIEVCKHLEACNQYSRMDDGEMNNDLKIFQRRDKRRDGMSLPISDLKGVDKNSNIEETSCEGSPDFDAFGKSWKEKGSLQNRCHLAYMKESNHLIRDGNAGRVRCKLGSSNHTQSNGGNVSPSSHDDNNDEDAHAGHADKGGDQHPTINIKPEHHTEQRPKAKHGQDVRDVSHGSIGHGRKAFGSKVLDMASKKSLSGGVTQLSSGGMEQKTEKKKGFSEGSSPLRKSSFVPEARRQRHRLILQDTLDDEDAGFTTRSREESLVEVVVNVSNAHSSPESEERITRNCGSGTLKTSVTTDSGSLQLPTVRKSSRVPKKRIFDGDVDEVPEPKRRQMKKTENGLEDDQNNNAEQDQANDTAGDDQLLSEFRPPHKRQCEKRDESHGPDSDEKELPLTARQRALRISKEGGDPDHGPNVEVPDGLMPGLPKKQKENLTEAEQAVKKKEAARRRKQQSERNAKEIQAVAIQKILGQESSRKRREEKLQKQRQEIEQAKQAASMTPAINSIRWVMGPLGNVVSFSQDVELPKIFSGPCSYPQEREKCAGPSCNNAYKYRDPKTRLPLCSLQCYRAVQRLPSVAHAC